MSHVDSIVNRIAESPEGGTAHLAGWDLPARGYFVGGAGSTLVFLSPNTVDYTLTRVFCERAHAAYVGWWTDEETGKVYVDQTDWLPTENAAAKVARGRHEIAFWDIGHAEEIRVDYSGGE